MEARTAARIVGGVNLDFQLCHAACALHSLREASHKSDLYCYWASLFSATQVSSRAKPRSGPSAGLLVQLLEVLRNMADSVKHEKEGRAILK